MTNRIFRTVADLLADTSSGRGENRQWFAGDFQYLEAASDATDHHVTTAGGVKLYVERDADSFHSSGSYRIRARHNPSDVGHAVF